MYGPRPRPKVIEDLEKVMLEKGLSMQSAALLIECSKSSVHRWISGQGSPGKVHVRAIRRAVKRMEKTGGQNEKKEAGALELESPNVPN